MTEQEEANRKLDEYEKMLLNELKTIDTVFIDCLKNRRYPNITSLYNHLVNNVKLEYNEPVSLEDFSQYYQWLYAYYYKVFVDNLPQIIINQDLVYPTREQFLKKLKISGVPNKLENVPFHPFISSKEPKKLEEATVPYKITEEATEEATVPYEITVDDINQLDGKILKQKSSQKKKKSKKKSVKRRRSKNKLKMKYII